jgi:hypothetical protein
MQIDAAFGGLGFDGIGIGGSPAAFGADLREAND